MYNIGIDLVYSKRLEKDKNNDAFLNRIFNDQEIKYIKKRNYNINTIAGLFASKEAFLKSIKKGINNYSLKDIEVVHDDNNAPSIVLHNELYDLYKDYHISLSISHDGDYATAIVLLFLDKFNNIDKD